MVKFLVKISKILFKSKKIRKNQRVILEASNVMLCNVVLHYVILCYVLFCFVMLCYFMSCSCYVMLCYIMLFYVMLFYVMLFYVMLCYVLLCYNRSPMRIYVFAYVFFSNARTKNFKNRFFAKFFS